jgi:hypothetical protein
MTYRSCCPHTRSSARVVLVGGGRVLPVACTGARVVAQAAPGTDAWGGGWELGKVSVRLGEPTRGVPR